MSKSDYPYAPDEFDVPAPEGAPVGVYRAPRSGWSKTWPFLLVAVIFAGLAVGGVAAISGGLGQKSPAEADKPAAEQPADGAAAEEPPAAEEPADTEEPPAAEEPAATEEPPADPATDLTALLAAADKGAYVRVLNDGGPAGEARTGKDALDAKGFTKTKAEDYPGDSGLTATTVWYTENRKETATAVAAILGIPAEQVTQAQVREGDVVVVVKSALAPAS
ncbi:MULTISPECIES: LytR C-terminal domain-containing protein [Oerskovia]|uniref:LytR C-terminal domain-containing protein n=1 Tax=Oerskovia rustica TaxID=2762237 RepID=A0ABR8RTC8_9CELL|nr:LytR C-terminal domain-containing protein [Oerskovia rustica]MBD7950892.1 LytR C-terminal domain-containing protein [Oerskovia rustica]